MNEKAVERFFKDGRQLCVYGSDNRHRVCERLYFSSYELAAAYLAKIKSHTVTGCICPIPNEMAESLGRYRLDQFHIDSTPAIYTISLITLIRYDSDIAIDLYVKDEDTAQVVSKIEKEFGTRTDIGFLVGKEIIQRTAVTYHSIEDVMESVKYITTNEIKT